VDIAIEEDTCEKTLYFTVSDNGRGMDEKQILTVHNPFYTTRTERKVGLGIPFLKHAAEICGGGLEIRSEKGRGTTIRAGFKSDCIDCPPLGDIAATLVALVVGWPGRDFSFRHVVDGEAFAVSTEDLVGILEDRNLLATPETAQWLRRYVTENIKTLRSGRE
jgi:signal transduction histidine kinase